jgi:hypothetical protein
LPIAKYFQYDLKIVPIYDFLQFRKGCLMGISMSSPTSGFRKWSEAHDPKIAGARAVAGDAAVIPVPDLDQGMMTQMNNRIVRGSCLEPVRSEANSHCSLFGQLQASGDDSRRPAGDGMAVVQFPAAGRAARLPHLGASYRERIKRLKSTNPPKRQ